MEISLVSDLHATHDQCRELSLPGGNILLLGGDLCPVEGVPQKVVTRLEQEFDKYNKVYAVLGNHEHYHGDFDTTEELYRKIFPSIYLLDNAWVELSEDVVLFGSTLWSDLNKGDPLVEASVRSWSDYKHISVGERRLRASDTLAAHKEAIRALYACLEANEGKKIIILTHFVPTSQACHPRYSMSLDNWFFYSNLEDIILDNSNIIAWCFGHTHDTYDFKIGNCRLMCNPRGYVTSYRQEQTGWNPNFKFEV